VARRLHWGMGWRAVAGWLVVLLLGCGSRSETVEGTAYIVGTPARDADCPGEDAGVRYTTPACSVNEDCLSVYAASAPAGTLHVVCFSGQCRSASECVHTNAGAPDYCRCGDEWPLAFFGCPSVCLQAEGEDEPSCQSRCGP
jgi:hypothetical protein